MFPVTQSNQVFVRIRGVLGLWLPPHRRGWSTFRFLSVFLRAPELRLLQFFQIDLYVLLRHALSYLLRHVQTTYLVLGRQGKLGFVVEASRLN